VSVRRKVKPRPKPLRERLPATGEPRDTPHTSRAVKGCACLCCRTHRRLDRRDRRDYALTALYEDAAVQSVSTGQNATEALRRAVGADD